MKDDGRSWTFAVLAVLLSDVMCAVTAYDYCRKQWWIRYEGYSGSASLALLDALPFAAAAGVCAARAWRARGRRREEGWTKSRRWSVLFAALAVLLSGVMCAVTAYHYCEMEQGGRYELYSAPAWVALLDAVPFAIAIAICGGLALAFRRRHRQTLG